MKKKGRNTYIYIYIYILRKKYNIYEAELKSNAFVFVTGKITDEGTRIINHKEAGPMKITSLLLNILTVSLKSNVPPLNESMYPSLGKFC